MNKSYLVIGLKDWTEIKAKGIKNKSKDNYLNAEHMSIIENAYFAASIDEIDKNINLGIFKNPDNNKMYTSGYNGICYLTDNDGKVDYSKVIRVTSKFEDITFDKMINQVVSDDEFEKYLFGKNLGKYNSEKDQELIVIQTDEKMIELEDGTFDDMSILLCIQFIYALKKLCSRPLYKMIDQQEKNFIGKVKGKIKIKENIKRNILNGREDRMYCRFSSSTTDVIENRILKAALREISYKMKGYYTNNPQSFTRINQSIAFCNEAMKDISDVKVELKDLRNLKLTGTYVHYNNLFLLAKIIFSTMSLFNANDEKKQEKEKYKIFPYNINMQLLYECYIRSLLKESLFKSEKEYILLDYNHEDLVLDRDIYIKGSLKPDIILKEKKADNYIVYDVKYKDFNNSYFSRRMDRLQVLAYCYFYDCTTFGLIFPNLSKGDNEVKYKYKLDMEFSDIYYKQILISKNKKIENIAGLLID